MATVYLGLGSNIGNSAAHIERAIELLGSSVSSIEQAPIYTSKAIGYTDQPDFYNTAVSGQTDLDPEALLNFIKTVEQQVGRTPSFRWGPREIDIDIIFYDKLIQQSGKLTLPHPSFRQRDFVLQPLCDLNPALTDPVGGQTVQALLAALPPDQKSLVREVDAET